MGVSLGYMWILLAKIWGLKVPVDVWYLPDGAARVGVGAVQRPVLFLIHGGAWRGGEARCSPQVAWLFFSKKTRTVGGFLKWWYPTTMGFPTKNDHFGVFWGYHHLRKHLVGGMKLWWLKCMVNFRDFPRETLYSAFLLFILWENKKNYRWCFHIFWFLTGSIHDSGENNDHIGALLQDRDHSTGFFCWGESSKLTPVGIVVSNSSGAHEIHAWLVNLPSP